MSLLLALTVAGGPVTITGTLAATETGDTASFAGLIDHTGTLAATEGSDVASFTGLINHTGTLVVTEGSDTASFTGLINHIGTLVATELGDTAAFAGEIISLPLEAPKFAPAGVRFAPIQVGEAVAKSARVQPSYGQVTAEGVDGRTAGSVRAQGIKATFKFAPASAAGEATAATQFARVTASVGEVRISAAAAYTVAPTKVRVYYGEGKVGAGGACGIPPAFIPVTHAPASAGGILNPSEEEMILMYLRHRSSKRLQKR